MSGETFRKLNLNNKDLDTKILPTVVGANGTSLGAISRINCEIEIGRNMMTVTSRQDHQGRHGDRLT